MYIQILTTIGIGILAILLIAWYNAFTSPYSGKPDFNIFLKENIDAVIITIIGLILIVALVGIAPEAALFIKSIIGLDIQFPISNGAIVILSAGLYEMVRKYLKTKK